jgi:hypothetical protein
MSKIIYICGIMSKIYAFVAFTHDDTSAYVLFMMTQMDIVLLMIPQMHMVLHVMTLVHMVFMHLWHHE